MGYGQYDLSAHELATRARALESPASVFREGHTHADMAPLFLKSRESRDSPNHPASVPIIFALDVSGSMGDVPRLLATKTLPTFMGSVLSVTPDPQVLFLAFGNAGTDRSPLQVGQFESEAALMDEWLTKMHLEGAGGGEGESYELAFYVAARKTATDAWEKRGKKGYFFMTGDERSFYATDRATVKRVLGDDLEADTVTTYALACEAAARYHVFFLVPDLTRAARIGTGAFWQYFLKERAIILRDPEDTAIACALLVGITEGTFTSLADLSGTLEKVHGRTGASQERVLEAVRPYAQAVFSGTLGPIVELGAPQPFPGMSG